MVDGGPDRWYGQVSSLADPSNEPYAVTPDDDNDLPNGECNYLYIGGEGNLVAQFKDRPGEDVTLPLGAGWHPLRPTRILEATTATGIIVCY